MTKEKIKHHLKALGYGSLWILVWCLVLAALFTLFYFIPVLFFIVVFAFSAWSIGNIYLKDREFKEEMKKLRGEQQ